MSTSYTGNSSSDRLQTIPLELVLRIINILALDIRDYAPAYARSLFLISRAVRQSLLPLLYEVVSTMATEPHLIIGWDGRPHTHPALSFLSWLLCNPSAEPRRHVKSLIFCHSYNFYPHELGLAGNTEPPEELSCQWLLDNVIATHQWDARQLKLAGIHARAAHSLNGIMVDGLGTSIGRGVVVFAVQLWDNAPQGRHYIRLFTEPAWDPLSPVPRSSFREISDIRSNAFLYRELDPQRQYDIREVPKDSRGVFIFIDLGSGDGFGEFSGVFLDEIALIFEKDTNAVFHVVLVYPKSEKDIVVDGVAEKLRAHCGAQVHSRLWIARSSTDRRLMTQDHHLWVARAIQQGIDPWETGRRVSEYILEDRREE